MDAMLFQQIKSKTRSHLACSAGILWGRVDFKKLAIFYSTGHIWFRVRVDGGGKGVGKGEIYPLPHPLIPLLLFDPCSPPDTNFFPFLAFCFCENQMATLIFPKITLSTHLPKLTLLCRLAIIITPVKMCIAQTSKFWPRKLCIQFHQKFGKFGFTTNFFHGISIIIWFFNRNEAKVLAW